MTYLPGLHDLLPVRLAATDIVLSRSTGISLQAMDNSHVALVALLMRQDGFEHYRCGELHGPARTASARHLDICGGALYSSP